MSGSFDIAVDGDQAFRFEYGPWPTAYVEPDVAANMSGPAVDLTDGRTVRQVQLSLFESIVDIGTWRLTSGAPERVEEADALTGYLAEDADTQLVQLRLLPPIPQRSPQFPTVLAGSSLRSDPKPVLEAAKSAIVAHAPEGWQGLTIECRVTVRRMELTATVTFPDGEVRSWSPPVMVSQWLHRLRMRDYRSVLGVWFTAGFEFTPDNPATQHFHIEEEPVWRVPQSNSEKLEHLSDELRFLPRRPEAIPSWLSAAAVKNLEPVPARALDAPAHEQVDHGGFTEMARLFDGRDGQGRPVWYRPMVGRPEIDAILRYLENAPLVLSSRGLSEDELSEEDEPRVPMGFHTDGRWVWSSAVAYYLREHDVPPALMLVDHIRQNRYQLPPELPEIAMGRAAAMAMGRPDDEARVETEFYDALTPLIDVLRNYRIHPRFFSLGEHRDQAWCLVRAYDWYLAYWADGEQPRAWMRFGDVTNAVAYLTGQIIRAQGSLQYGLDEEIPWWHAPYGCLSELDPPLQEFTGVMLTEVVDAVVDRYGTPDGNMFFVADTPFEQRGLPADHADREYHRYLLPGTWQLLTAVSQAGGRLYLVAPPISELLASGAIQEVTETDAQPTRATNHPGLPPVTDALREEAKRNPDGWVWCADPDVDSRYIEGTPNFTLLGAYKVGPDGELTGETFVNDEYRPSPRERGYPEPRSEFELVLGFVAAGWLPQERILSTVLDSEFLLETDGEGGLRIGIDANGRRFLAVYSSPGYLPPDANAPMQAQGRGLLGVLSGVTLVVNPGGEMGIELPGDDLIAAGQ